MPGHKGVEYLGIERYDITEINGADTLYHTDGIIAESEANATKLFGTAHTFYSTEGSTLSIKAMLATALVVRNSNMQKRLLCARGVHKALIYAAAELDFDIDWIYPEQNEHFCSCTVTPEKLRERLSFDTLPFAVYITSPDYLGKLADIGALSSVCHEFGVPLLVDNAHGAYLAFLSESQHPIALGADMCADSAHKTLPVLTGGAYLHISRFASPELIEIAAQMLSAFASTSPSYLILESLDLANCLIADGYKIRIGECIARVEQLKLELSKIGFSPIPSESMKIVFRPTDWGYLGTELAEHLRNNKIEVEFADSEYTVLMPSCENTEQDYSRIFAAISSLRKKPFLKIAVPEFVPPEKVLSVKEAVFSHSEVVSVRKAIGRICAAPTAACPPAVPIVVSGEAITEQISGVLSAYGIKSIRVVK